MFSGLVSVVHVLDCRAVCDPALLDKLRILHRTLEGLANDFEIVVVDNDCEAQLVERLRALSKELSNLQIYRLSRACDPEIAQIAGLENSIGDYVVLMNLCEDPVDLLPQMLRQALAGNHVVFARNVHPKPRRSWLRRLLSSTFHRLYDYLHGVHLPTEASPYRMLSRAVVNFILQHDLPHLSYELLPVTSGFSKTVIEYNQPAFSMHAQGLRQTIRRRLSMLVASNTALLRIITLLCVFGAGANIVYSIYVIFTYFLRNDVAPGWATLSLQMSGMFLLLSLVLLVLTEYISHLLSATVKRPLYYISEEFSSSVLSRRAKLNIEDGR